MPRAIAWTRIKISGDPLPLAGEPPLPTIWCGARRNRGPRRDPRCAWDRCDLCRPCRSSLLARQDRPAMVHTTRTASTARLLPAIPMRRSLCHRVRVACRARRPRIRPLRVTGICKRLPNMAAWAGRKRRGTTGVPWWKPILAAGNGSSVLHCAGKPTSVKRPKWQLPSTS
jgi:hypothetical protein